MNMKNKIMDIKYVLRILAPLRKKLIIDWVIPNMCYYDFALNYLNNSTRKILDVGCGYGYGTYYLSNKIDSCRIVGVDIDKSKIQTAKRIYKHPKLVYYTCDVNKDSDKLISREGKFDLIVCFEVLEHIPQSKEKSFLTSLKKLLKKNGVLILSTPNKSVWDISSYTPDHVNEKEYKELEGILGKYFEIVEEYGVLFMPSIFCKITWGLNLAERIGNRKNNLNLPKKLVKIVTRVLLQPSVLMDRILKKVWRYEYYKRLVLQGCPRILPNKIGLPKVVLFVLKNK